MAEQTFRSPGYFDSELDQSVRQEQGPAGVPAGLVSTSDKGPAFVPVTVRDFANFKQTFGDLNPKRFGPYAANEFLKHRTALTFLRVLGAGSLDNSADITRFQITGQARNAGFVVTGSAASGDSRGRLMGAVQMITAHHQLRSNEAFGMPMFTNNSSFSGSTANLVRGMVLLASGCRMMVLGGDESAVGAFSGSSFLVDDTATPNANGKFKLVLSSSDGASFGIADGNVGMRIYTASLNPTNADYFVKLLNTDPEKFAELQHVVYADFAVDDELATPDLVGVVVGSTNTSNVSGDSSMAFNDVFGHFDAKYTSPKTPSFISQPFGATEYDLFHIEALDDGEFANSLYKISIADLKISNDQSNPYGTFSVLVRAWTDDDNNPQILESYPQCSLDPESENYVARRIGDRKVRFNFESDNVTERRLIADGKYANQSSFVRIVMNEQVERKHVPTSALPFGFRGVEVLKTNDGVTDRPQATGLVRLSGSFDGTTLATGLTGSILPPIPYRFKVTNGEVATSGYVGNPGPTELTNGNYYWGVKFERNTTPLSPNAITDKNAMLASITKFLGIKKLDALLTGSNADLVCNNKFTLAKVAFSNTSIADLTSSIENHMREASYVRNGVLDASSYTINDGTIDGRITMGTLASLTSSVQFNRFSPFAKYTTLMYGGFDGLNILDRSAHRMSDKSVSFDIDGGAEASYVSPGLAQNQGGVTTSNNGVVSYRTAIDIMTNQLYVNTNILAVPGIREPYIASYAAQKTKEYGLAIYLMDLVPFDDTNTRLYDETSGGRPDVSNTAKNVDGRSIDNNYVSTYFPDVFVDDATNKRRVKVPASVAALAALGYNDRVSYPWFAPAGFNRASLDFVTNVAIRVNAADRDTLYDARINPIVTFPKQGFVIFGQKTMQQARSALDRVNVRRLLLEVKRIVIDIANKLVFEQNTPEARQKFVTEAGTRLGLIQTQAGIEEFRIVMDSTNNSDQDAQDNKLNGRIVLVPTRTIENIAMQFIITNSGVTFEQ